MSTRMTPGSETGRTAVERGGLPRATGPKYPTLFPSPLPQRAQPALPKGVVPGIHNPGEAPQPGAYSDEQVIADWVARGGTRKQLADNPKLMEGLRREGLKAHAPVTTNQSRSRAMSAAMGAAARVRAGAY